MRVFQTGNVVAGAFEPCAPLGRGYRPPVPGFQGVAPGTAPFTRMLLSINNGDNVELVGTVELDWPGGGIGGRTEDVAASGGTVDIRGELWGTGVFWWCAGRRPHGSLRSGDGQQPLPLPSNSAGG
jgi:hypothetical protein